ncbi:MAG: cell division protein FtsQ/DivIB [Paracoccaceae bacterium]
MRPLIAPRRPMPRAEPPLTRATAPRRDPAPSRVAYRLHRLWLTPVFRAFLRLGLPVFVAVFAVGIYLADADRRAALLGDWAALRQAVEERPEFMVQLVVIDGASSEVDGAVRQALGVTLPVSSFELDLEALRATIAGLDAVASVDLYVRAGGILQIDLTERQPSVVWRGETGLGLLDAEGHPVRAIARREDRPDLPLLAGAGVDRAVPEALALIAAAAPVADRLRGLVRVGERRWDVVLDRDQRIMLPESDPQRALERIIALDQAQGLLARDITLVDLRNADRPTLRLTEAALGELHRIRGTVLGVTAP